MVVGVDALGENEIAVGLASRIVFVPVKVVLALTLSIFQCNACRSEILTAIDTQADQDVDLEQNKQKS